MMLTIDRREPGLWTNPAWSGDQPGLFAVIVGVSRYRHLDGGSDPADEDGGWVSASKRLGQLEVSALTAHDFFVWLAAQYRFEGVPIATVRLLLEATEAEEASSPDMRSHARGATLDDCTQALSAWRRQMQSLPPAVAAQSRALFFFSGHGIEVQQGNQVLLPSDYLALDTPNAAVSTANIERGLGALHVPVQFLFIDACRSDAKELREKLIVGREIFDEPPAAKVNLARNIPILYASSVGGVALQHKAPAAGRTIYGQALLEGLRGQAPMKLECGTESCSVGIYPLLEYVQRRVAEIIRATGEGRAQHIRMGGQSAPEVVTEIEPPEVGPRDDPGPRPTAAAAPGPGDPPGPRDFSDEVESIEVARMIAPKSRDGVPQTLVNRYAPLAEHLYGSDGVKTLWVDGLTQWRFEDDAPLGAPKLNVYRVERVLDGSYLRAELSSSVVSTAGDWLEWKDGEGESWGTSLMRDADKATLRYLVDTEVVARVDEDGSAHGVRLVRLASALSPRNQGLVGAVARAWSRHAAGSRTEALRLIHDLYKSDAFRRGESPLAAIVAATISLRERVQHDTIELLLSIVAQHPQFVDLDVLIADMWLRHPKYAFDDRLRLAATAMSQLAYTETIPITSEAFAAAVTRVAELDRHKGLLSEETRERLEVVSRRLGSSVAIFRAGGFFATFGNYLRASSETPLPQKFEPEVDYAPAVESQRGGSVAVDAGYVTVGGVRVKRSRRHGTPLSPTGPAYTEPAEAPASEDEDSQYQVFRDADGAGV